MYLYEFLKALSDWLIQSAWGRYLGSNHWKTHLIQAHADHFLLYNHHFLLHQDRDYLRSNLLPNDSSINLEDWLQKSLQWFDNLKYSFLNSFSISARFVSSLGRYREVIIGSGDDNAKYAGDARPKNGDKLVQSFENWWQTFDLSDKTFWRHHISQTSI